MKSATSVILLLLLMSVVYVAVKRTVVSASTTIYIMPDGSVSPSTAPISSYDNVTYVLTGNISSSTIVVERSSIAIDGAGFTVQGPGSSVLNSMGIDLGWGIGAISVYDVTIKRLNIRDFYYGVFLNNTHDCSITGNNISSTSYGIWAQGPSIGSYYNRIVGNNIVGSAHAGVELYNGENYNTVASNNLTGDYWGICVAASSYNNISRNDVAWNNYGIFLIYQSSNNRIYHNNNINNTYSELDDAPNIWDDGYPSGGNYWSDYTGVDEKSGPYQNETGSDGKGDTSYVTNDNVNDSYPLMSPIIHVHDVAITSLTNSKICPNCSTIVVCQNFTINISFPVADLGEYGESFGVTTTANATVINQTQVTLEIEESVTCLFTWNTTGFVKGNYTINVTAQAVPGEINVTNNVQTCWVYVSMVVDITGGTPDPWDFVPDGKDTGLDLGIVARCVGSWPGCVLPMIWNANCDINNNGRVDGTDLGLVALHVGQADP